MTLMMTPYFLVFRDRRALRQSSIERGALYSAHRQERLVPTTFRLERNLIE